jgi:peptide chain release factor 1
MCRPWKKAAVDRKKAGGRFPTADGRRENRGLWAVPALKRLRQEEKAKGPRRLPGHGAPPCRALASGRFLRIAGKAGSLSSDFLLFAIRRPPSSIGGLPLHFFLRGGVCEKGRFSGGRCILSQEGAGKVREPVPISWGKVTGEVKQMFDRLKAIEDRYDKLTELLSDPEVLNDPEKLRKYSKEQSDLEETVQTYRQYKEAKKQLQDAKSMLEEKLDPELREMVKEEIGDLEEKIAGLEEQLKLLLIPKDPNDEKNVIMEIRGAAGGEEAALFAGDLFRMYTKYAESQGWKIDVIDAHPTGLGGYKEIIFMINGKGAYSKLKYENGAHRVQRVPETESGGRIHTSTATVACLPEAEEVEVEINEKDIRVDTFASSGPGGQSVNTTMSAVRLTHIPTGIVVSCQDEKSQIKNKEKAMKVLRARILDKYRQEARAEYDAKRKSAVGTGDRSERIRTYNFPQNRVTDHRVGLTLQKLDQVLEGKLDEIIDVLILDEQAKKLQNENLG